jgi:3-deoxy-D-manno-octulosonic-acid transferase
MTAGGLVPLWRGLGVAGRPLLAVLIAVRKARGKEHPTRSRERFGRPSAARPAGPLVWVHAASVGETAAVLPLVERLAERGIAVVLTTGTVTSAKIAAERLPAGAVHQFAPLDVVPYLRRFLDHWRPDAAFFVESELWPVALGETAARGIPRIIVNGRLSERSLAGWRRVPRTAAAVFGRISLCLAQSDEDAERFARLGIADVRVAGNLKADVAPPPADAAALAALRAAVGDRPRWVAASTHPGEEAVVAAAHAALTAGRPGLLTVIVPRHPSRGSAVAAAVAATGARVALRSRGDAIGPDVGVYVADTIGELGLFYRLAPIAFVGGSIAVRGGQNPIEPVRLGAAVLAGPRVENFRALYADLEAAGGMVGVRDTAGLAAAVGRLLDDPAAAARQAAAAAAVADAHAGALGRTLAVLEPILARLSGEPSGSAG